MKENNKKNNRIDIYRRIEIAFVALFLLAVIAAEIYRLVRWDFTWDESLTYCIFVKPAFFEGRSLAEIIDFFRDATGCWCAMNNHLLNTLAMAAFAKLLFPVFGYGNEIVLRLPVILSFCLYIGGVLYLFKRKRITWLGVVLLCGSRYVMDFFALSRGYSIAACFVLLACICMIEWEEKPEKEWLVILCAFFVTVGIVAQTVTLLIAAPIYLWLLARVLQRKVFLNYLKPKRLVVILPLVVINWAMVMFHFAVSRADHCLAPSGDTSLRSVIRSMFIGGETGTYFTVFTIIIAAILVAGWALFLRKKISWQTMSFVVIISAYVIVMSVIINTIRMGLPVSRMLLPAYPVMALAIYTCLMELKKNLPAKVKLLPIIICCLAIVGVWHQQNDLSLSKEWPSDQGIRAQCYEALENGTQAVPPAINTERSQSWYFYQDKILTNTGVDVVAQVIFQDDIDNEND